MQGNAPRSKRVSSLVVHLWSVLHGKGKANDGFGMAKARQMIKLIDVKEKNKNVFLEKVKK
jgi:hypothetical protein